MNCISDFFTYETTKSVVVKSWTIGIINRAVQLLIISYFVGWVFLHEKAYQVRDTAIESSVVTKVKGFGRYANRVMDVSDYVTPPQGTSVFVIITKMIVTENQMQGFCPESEEKFRCVSDSQCRPERFPGGGILTGRCVNYSSALRTCEIQGWCPAEVDTVETPVMMEAENFTIFIKNSIRFPLFNFEKGNLLPDLTAADVKTCRFHPDRAPFCPILRVGDVVKFAGQDFAKLAQTGGVLGIKIGWVCDLDKAWDQCIPRYSFTRLDGVSEKSSVSPGYNFRFAKYYKMDNGSEYRTLLKAFGIRFDVLVYGDVSSGPGARGETQAPSWPRGRGLPLTRPETLAGHISAARWGWGAPTGPPRSLLAPRPPWLGVQVKPQASPGPAGRPAHSRWSSCTRLASSTSSPPSSAPWRPSPRWEWAPSSATSSC
ncbi:P2X purinoceptor 3 isoform X1 [Ovis canadensis]|uniref:P2X purinoceptor 3 isoform X1 n=1 Tax=Ovis canadensis TaxID=37174 RepID=UPI0037510A00